jgi:hypothetical protein
MDGVTSIEVYGTAPAAGIEVTPVAEPAANTKQWTFSMPGSDVVLTPVYYPGMLTLPASLTGGKLEVVGMTGPFTKLEVLKAWENDNTLLSAANLPGLKEMTDDEAKNWTDVPSAYAILIYGFDGTKAKIASYIAGELFDDPTSEEVKLSQLKDADADLYYPSVAQLPAGFEQDEKGNIYVADKTEFQVKAVPAEGYRLVSLMFGETDVTDQVDADGIATLTMPEGNADITLTATFSNEYTVALNAEGLTDEEAANWKAATGDNDPAAFPLENVKYGTEVKVTYTGSRKVIGVKAEKKAEAPAPAEGKTYTNLQGGEVMHVGDKITETYGKFRSTHHENPQLTDYNTYMFSSRTYEVVRADVAYVNYNYEYTESPNGQYYVIKCTYFDSGDTEEWVTEYYFNQKLPVTGTSDGITVTLDGQDGNQRNLYTFWVHEPNP